MAGAPRPPAPRPRPRPSPTGTEWKSVILGGQAINYTSAYGAHRGGRWHTGVDIGAARGTDINMPMSGTVVAAGYGAGGGNAFGNAVLIKLSNGDYMYFAHLSKIGVKVGQKLKPGDFVGDVGSTGNSTGPHLHIEIRRASTNGRWSRTQSAFYDPVAYLNRNASAQGQTSTRTDPGNSATRQDETEAAAPGGTTTSSGGDSGGWQMEKFSRAEFYRKLDEMFGDIDILLGMDDAARRQLGGKSIRWAINEAVKQKITSGARFATLLKQTGWFKRYGERTTELLIQEKHQPGVFNEAVGEVRSQIAQAAANYGVVLDEATLKKLARDAYVFQWDTNAAEVLDRIQREAMKSGSTATFAGGNIGDAVEEVTKWARDYGVELSDADVRQLRNDMLDGVGYGNVQELLQERSAQTYAVYADDIRAGTSLRSLISPYLQSAAQLLEVSEEDIDMDDPLFTGGQAFQTIDPNTGKPVQRTLADFQKMVRKDSRWQSTKNARDTASEMSMNILRQMGLV